MQFRLIAPAAGALAIAVALTSCGGGGDGSPTGPPPPAAVASVEIAPLTSTITLSQTVQLTATAKDASGSVLAGRVVTWSQTNGTIATVNGVGLVSALGVGTTTITATSEGKSGNASVTVTPVPVANVVISPTSPSIQVGQTAQLSATTTDASGATLTGRTVTWSTSNAATATVSVSGLVTAVAPGSATITATSEGKTGSTTVTVVPVPVATVVITPVSPSVIVGQTVQLSASTLDAGGNVLSGRVITWATGNSGIATVSASGLVTGVGTGSATITATSEGKSGSVTVTVTPAPVAVTLVVTNQLIDIITVNVNGTAVGTVPASSTRQTTVNVTGSLTVSYDLIRPTTTSGSPIGDPISGVFPTVQSPSGTYTVNVDNFLGTQQYFSPLITNNALNPILMVVNWGLVSENRCGCSVPAGGTNVNIGYYKLFSNTQVRGYGTISGYGNGTYVFWDYSTFGTSVQTGSGVVYLTNSLTLSIMSSALLAPGSAGSLTKGLTAFRDIPNPQIAGSRTLGQALQKTR